MFDIIVHYISAIIFINVPCSIAALINRVYQEKIGELSMSSILNINFS